LIGGDILFYCDIGRTDLPEGNPAVMRESLRKLMRLPDHTRVFAGHMTPTSIIVERRKNPHVRYALGEDSPASALSLPAAASGLEASATARNKAS